MPKWLNSKQDILLCMELANDGQLEKEQLKKKLQDLLSDEKVYAFQQIVNEAYTASVDEKVCEVKKDDGSVEYHLYKLQENPNARFAQMGFTKEELQNLLNQLEA